MNKRTSAPELLEDVLSLSKLQYLSDLHAPEHRSAVRQAVEQLVPAEYPPAAWREAVAYILRVEAPASSAPEAYAFLLEQLQ